jgi:imidazolonepropionase-like amidohydrolase
MHTHSLSSDKIPTWFSLFVANGVVGIRDMGSSLPAAEIQALKNGKHKPSPRIYAAGRTIGGFVDGQTIIPTSPEAGRQAVRELKAGGSDFIKVATQVPADIFFAIADEARKLEISIAGHVPLTVPLSKAATAGMKSFEHSYGVLEACSNREQEVRQEIEQAALGHASRAESWGAIVQATDRAYGRQASDGTYNRHKCEELAATLSSYGTWQCPTLMVRRAFALLNDPKLTADDNLKYISRPLLSRWKSTLTTDERSRGMTDQLFSDRRVRLRKESETAALLMRKGVRLLAGTDCGDPFVVPGFSLHDELALLVDAGLTPLQALESATLNPARFLGIERDFGTVERGKIAGLVLISADPLADIRNTRKIEAVIMDGVLYDRRTLNKMLAGVEAASR